MDQIPQVHTDDERLVNEVPRDLAAPLIIRSREWFKMLKRRRKDPVRNMGSETTTLIRDMTIPDLEDSFSL